MFEKPLSSDNLTDVVPVLDSIDQRMAHGLVVRTIKKERGDAGVCDFNGKVGAVIDEEGEALCFWAHAALPPSASAQMAAATGIWWRRSHWIMEFIHISGLPVMM